MRNRTIGLTALGLVLAIGVGFYSTGNFNSLQGSFHGAAGAVTFSVASDTPKEDIVIAGNNGVEVSKYSLAATVEDFVISTLTINDKTSASDDNISKITLSYSDGTSTVSSDGYLVSGVATFSGLSIYVPKGSTTTALDVSVDLNSISGGADSGEQIQLVLGSTGFSATGLTTGTVLTSLRGTGTYRTNPMTVYETKPTLALASDNPTGPHSQASADTIFKFNVTAGSEDKVNIRAASALATCTDTALIIATSTSSRTIDGSACSVADVQTAADYIPFDTTNIQNYKYASFWVKFVDGGGSATALTAGTLGVGTSQTVSGSGVANKATQSTTLTAAMVGGSATNTFVSGVWTFVHDVPLPTPTDSGDVNVGVKVVAAGNGLDNAADMLVIDQFILYNDKITVDMASDASLYSAADGQAAYLRGGSSDITGYVFLDSTSSAQVTFFPTVDLSTAKSSETHYSIETATTTLITNETTMYDTLLPSITYGASIAGRVTAGGFWWNDTTSAVTTGAISANSYAINQWLGYFSTSTLVSSPLSY